MAARSIFSRLGSAAWLARKAVRARLGGGPMPAILMYHRIAEESFDPWGLAVSPANFRSQLAWLSEFRTVVSLQTFAEGHRRGSLPADAVAVTIDDAYSCISELAAPILCELGVPATVFVPVDLIGDNQPFWWDELEQIILQCSGSTLSLAGEEILIGEQSCHDRVWPPRSAARTTRQAAFQIILHRLTRMRSPAREEMMDQLRSQAPCAAATRPMRLPMSSEALRNLGDVVSIGSHTRTHPWLPCLDGEEKVREIIGSIERLVAVTGTRPITFAYPYGACDERSRQLAKSAGFLCACVTANSTVPRWADVYALPRVSAGNWNAAELQQALLRT